MGGVARKCDEEDALLQEQLINIPLTLSLFQPEHHFVFFSAADAVQLNLCCEVVLVFKKKKKKKKAGFSGWN